jgi:hypothetical protein
MHANLRRGLLSTLFAGGLLALGTTAASAAAGSAGSAAAGSGAADLGAGSTNSGATTTTVQATSVAARVSAPAPGRGALAATGVNGQWLELAAAFLGAGVLLVTRRRTV